MYPTRKTSGFLDKESRLQTNSSWLAMNSVFKCPTWQWESGDPQKRKPFLPEDKQYLVTRTAPCQNRVSTMENMMAMDNDNDDDGIGW
jgi:ubiquitin-like-conjugating enzyme ATG3